MLARFRAELRGRGVNGGARRHYARRAAGAPAHPKGSSQGGWSQYVLHDRAQSPQAARAADCGESTVRPGQAHHVPPTGRASYGLRPPGEPGVDFDRLWFINEHIALVPGEDGPFQLRPCSCAGLGPRPGRG